MLRGSELQVGDKMVGAIITHESGHDSEYTFQSDAVERFSSRQWHSAKL